MSLVTVILLIHSQENPFLQDCLNSLYRQNFRDFELIVIVSESFLVVNKFHSFFPLEMPSKDREYWNYKVFVYPESENFSVSQGSNFGIAQAKGKYVVRIDPDDRFDENLLMVAMNHLEQGKKSYGAVYPDFLEIDEKGQVVGYGSPEVSFEFNPLDAGVVYNKEKLIEIGGYDERLFRQVSYDLMKRFTQKFDVKHVALPLYHYRKHSSNMSSCSLDLILYSRKVIESGKGKVLCVIPARGGSKGIPLKNLYNLNGKPLISYVIEAAKKSQLIDKIVVSTDHSGIREVAVSLGVDVEDRPGELATDEVSIISVAAYHLKNQTKKYGAVISLQPTSPLVTADDLDGAICKFFGTNADSVVSVYKVSHNHPFRVMKLVKDRLFPFSDSYDERVFDRRDLPPCYAYNGSFFIRKPILLENWGGKDFGLGKDCRGYVMPEERSINVDELFDLRLAEIFLQLR